MDAKAILDQFLNVPISSSDEIFAIFAQLPGAIREKGKKPLQQFVYVPGIRKDRVLLVAHADTVWHTEYGNPQEASISYMDGVYSSANELCGIGADDVLVFAMGSDEHAGVGKNVLEGFHLVHKHIAGA